MTNELMFDADWDDEDFELPACEPDVSRRPGWMFDPTADELPALNRRARQFEVVASKTRLEEADFAHQAAIRVAVAVGWGLESIEVLRMILEESGNMSATERRLVELGEGGVTVAELGVAFELRQEWWEYAPMDRVLFQSGFDSMWRLPSHRPPSWSVCIELIRCFDGLPDAREILVLVGTIYDEWIEENSDYRMRGRLAPAPPSSVFTTYCRRRFDGCDAMFLSLGGYDV